MSYAMSSRIARVAMATAVMLVAMMMSQVYCNDSDYNDYNGFNIECYRDLCNNRQYCSEKERRCKPCLRAHCLDKDYTPKECESLCPGLLNPPTTTQPTTTTSWAATTVSSTKKPPSVQQTWHLVNKSGSSANVASTDGSHDRNEFFIPGVNQSTFTGVLLLLVLALLAVVIVLAVLGVRLTWDIRRRLPPRRGALEEGRMGTRIEEDHQPLLIPELGKKRLSETNGTAHAKSSLPHRSTGLAELQQQQETIDSSSTPLVGLAPASEREDHGNNEQRGNNYLHQLITNNA